MRMDPTELYIDLLKKTLEFDLWDEPGMPVTLLPARRPGHKLLHGLSHGLQRLGYQVTKLPRADRSKREAGATWPTLAHSMIGSRRLDNIRDCVQTVIREDIPGDFIETGVWRGGAVILMKGILKACGSVDRRVFAADSFQGLPPPDQGKYPADAGDDHHRFRDYLGVSRQQVEESFRRYGLLDDKVVFLEGWFKDTLASAPIERLAILRLDGDMYESTHDALQALYPKLQPGGFCIVDDYSHPACRQAVDDYFRAHDTRPSPTRIDWSGAFWRKPFA